MIPLSVSKAWRKQKERTREKEFAATEEYAFALKIRVNIALYVVTAREVRFYLSARKLRYYCTVSSAKTTNSSCYDAMKFTFCNRVFRLFFQGKERERKRKRTKQRENSTNDIDYFRAATSTGHWRLLLRENWRRSNERERWRDTRCIFSTL